MDKTIQSQMLCVRTIYNGVNIICINVYICMVTEVCATPETQLLGPHESSWQCLIVIFLLLANCVNQICGIFRYNDCLLWQWCRRNESTVSTVHLSVIWIDFSIQLAIACPWLLSSIKFQWSQARSLSITLRTSRPQKRTVPPIRGKYPVRIFPHKIWNKNKQKNKTLHVIKSNRMWWDGWRGFNLFAGF